MEKINKAYVLEKKKENDRYKTAYYKYCTVPAGWSDIAALTYRTSDPKEIGELAFGEDGDYKAHLIANETPVPDHYNLVLDTNEPWLWIYDDDEKVLDLENDRGFQIYRAGMMGLLIRFK